jgi:hypothetical protein
MPYLGAGVDQHVNTTPLPTWVFTPNPVGSATVRFYNEGNQPVFIGGANVTPLSGIPLYPGSKPFELQNCNQTVYSCSNLILGAALSTTSTAYAAGVTSFTMKATVPTGLAAGATFPLANTAGTSYYEVLTVAATSASSAITTTTASLYDHGSAATFCAITTVPGQLRVTAGVV